MVRLIFRSRASCRLSSMRPADTSEEAWRVQIEAYQRMSPAARLRVGLELTETSRRLLVAGIERRHPDYDPEQVRWAFLRLWLGPELFAAAYRGKPEVDP
jgi:hypothetical protein